jgi:competence ComEA-like helix-hairpin-helix protein
MFSKGADSVLTERLTISLLLALVCSTSGCVKREFHQAFNKQFSASTAENLKTAARININTASATELETLPGIGPGLAQRIIEHREKYGPFRKTEHLIIVRGISDKRFQALRDLITVE